MTTSCTDINHPYYKQISEKNSSKEIINFFNEEPKRMRYVSLGEALDFISYGGLNHVVWPFNKREIVGFVKNWMRNQEPKIEREKIPTEGHSYTYKVKSREFFYMWNRFADSWDVELPFIDLENCPLDEKHTERIKDLKGRVRCAHLKIDKFKPNYIEEMKVAGDSPRKSFMTIGPCESSLDEFDFDSEEGRKEHEKYLQDLEKFVNEEASLEVKDACYSILSDKGINLPLEKILYRLDVIDSWNSNKGISVYPFSGFELANYVGAWWKQEGKKKFFMKPGEVENFRFFKGFQLMSSGD